MRGKFGGVIMTKAIKTAKFSQKHRFYGDKQVIESDKKLRNAQDHARVSATDSLPESSPA